MLRSIFMSSTTSNHLRPNLIVASLSQLARFQSPIAKKLSEKAFPISWPADHPGVA